MDPLSPAEVHALAVAQGLDADGAIVATAIAWAESGLRSDAVGDVDLEDDKWGPSYGLYQIRSLRAYKGTGMARDAERLVDPAFNTRSMFVISAGGTDWMPWSMFKNGRYREHLDAVRAAVGGAPMKIVTRSEWGAAAVGDRMAPADYPMGALWLHHSDTVPTDDPAADMRQLQQIGLSRGFSDISYTFGLHPDGTILEGRELRYIGAHTAGNNSTSLAFVLIGTYTTIPPTDAQISSERWLRDYLVADGYLTPGTYPTGGHRDAPDNSTGCPGDAAEACLPLFRAASDDPGTDPPLERNLAMLTFRYVAEGLDWVFDGPSKLFFHLDDVVQITEVLDPLGVKALGQVSAATHRRYSDLAASAGFTG